MRIVVSRLLALMAAILAHASAFAEVLESGAVAAPDRYGAEVAAQILKKGGNAVDAAVATAFTLAVTYPEAGNIGGPTATNYTTTGVLLQTLIHTIFIFSAIGIAWVDKMTATPGKGH